MTEVSKTSFSEILYRMTGSVFVGSFCLFGMIFWAIRHPSLAVAYAPLAGFAIFSVVLGNRALFYSAPFFWFGGAIHASKFFRKSMFSQSLEFGMIL